MSAATQQEIRSVVHQAVTIFAASGLSCCLFGGAGCLAYGCSRTPNDVDIIIMTNLYTTEALKNILVNGGGGSFYTRPSKKIGATYRIVFYRLPSQAPLRPRPRSCKVDVLIPGIMNIPTLPVSSIVRIDGLPVLPFFALLMLKVQGWSDHRHSDRSDYRSKQYQDVDDINMLLAIGKQRGENLMSGRKGLPADFAEIGGRLIAEYVNTRGGRSAWEDLGVGFIDG